MSITKLKMMRIEETLKDFKCLVPRFNEVKNDEVLLKDFCSRNRNPIWDLTNIKYFKTGLKSEGLIRDGGKGVDDHYIQRSLCMEIIFTQLNNNPDMSVDEFIGLLRKYSSTISITKDEHMKITQLTKGTGVMNYLMYEKCDIIVPGLMEHIGY